MLEIAPGWTVVVERGPDWLFARVTGPPDSDLEGADLSEALWSLLKQHFTYRLVVELNEAPSLGSQMLSQLRELQQKLQANGGLLRICGLSDKGFELVRADQLHEHFPRYRNREEAVMGAGPKLPR